MPALKQVGGALVCLSFYQTWNNQRCNYYDYTSDESVKFLCDQINQARKEAEAEVQRVLSNWRPPTPLKDNGKEIPTARRLFSAVSHAGATTEDKE